MEGADAPQLKPGKCGCDRKPGPTSGIICPSCEHGFGLHDPDAGCVDGVDHPGSVGPETATQPAHGPSAEQWARGIAVLAINLRPEDGNSDANYRAAVAYILNGDQ